jgi:hypothetical protein
VTSSGEIPRASATTCAAVVSWPCPCGTCAERDDDLAEDVELDRRHLVVAGELQVRVQELRLPEVVRPGVERRADPDPSSLAALFGVAPALLDPVVADQLERDVEAARVVARVVDTAVRSCPRELVGLDVVPLPHLDRIEPELVGDDVDHSLREPEVLHPRVARGSARPVTCSSPPG